ncbi:olfactory receptor 6F1-like [Carettochelys insculpta]|uniref:olfactory receptor 6F1-like n=1 Tax=Carettochelys insculpta TaxID=44489 RepID=UPI003EB70554
MEPATGKEKENQSSVWEFLLLGFPGNQDVQMSLCVVFTVTYILTVAGNISIIGVVGAHSHLQTPMYFFLSSLSFLEIWYTTACIPKAIAVFLGKSRTISFASCILQGYIVFSLGCTEFFLLTVMAYDRYLAICYPLHYSTIMNNTRSAQLAFVCWVAGFLVISVPTSIIVRLSFCDSYAINHFFCGADSLILLSCSDTSLFQWVTFIMAMIVILGSFLITLVSYSYIISTIVKIPSAQGRQKAFSTCSAHFMVVIIWYGSNIFLYVRYSKQNALDISKIVNTLGFIMTPLLNPFIYTLRNKEVKEALWKLLTSARVRVPLGPGQL